MDGSNDRLLEWARYAVPRPRIAVAVVSLQETDITAYTAVLRPVVSRKRTIPISKCLSTIVSWDARAFVVSEWVVKVCISNKKRWREFNSMTSKDLIKSKITLCGKLLHETFMLTTTIRFETLYYELHNIFIHNTRICFVILYMYINLLF